MHSKKPRNKGKKPPFPKKDPNPPNLVTPADVSKNLAEGQSPLPQNPEALNKISVLTKQYEDMKKKFIQYATAPLNNTSIQSNLTALYEDMKVFVDEVTNKLNPEPLLDEYHLLYFKVSVLKARIYKLLGDNRWLLFKDQDTDTVETRMLRRPAKLFAGIVTDEHSLTRISPLGIETRKCTYEQDVSFHHEMHYCITRLNELNKKRNVTRPEILDTIRGKIINNNATKTLMLDYYIDRGKKIISFKDESTTQKLKNDQAYNPVLSTYSDIVIFSKNNLTVESTLHLVYANYSMYIFLCKTHPLLHYGNLKKQIENANLDFFKDNIDFINQITNDYILNSLALLLNLGLHSKCRLIRRSDEQYPFIETFEKIKKNKYIITETTGWYFNQKSGLEKLEFLDKKSLRDLANRLRLTGDRDTTEQDHELIRSYTNHTHIHVLEEFESEFSILAMNLLVRLNIIIELYKNINLINQKAKCTALIQQLEQSKHHFNYLEQFLSFIEKFGKKYFLQNSPGKRSQYSYFKFIDDTMEFKELYNFVELKLSEPHNNHTTQPLVPSGTFFDDLWDKEVRETQKHGSELEMMIASEKKNLKPTNNIPKKVNERSTIEERTSSSEDNDFPELNYDITSNFSCDIISNNDVLNKAIFHLKKNEYEACLDAFDLAVNIAETNADSVSQCRVLDFCLMHSMQNILNNVLTNINHHINKRMQIERPVPKIFETFKTNFDRINMILKRIKIYREKFNCLESKEKTNIFITKGSELVDNTMSNCLHFMDKTLIKYKSMLTMIEINREQFIMSLGRDCIDLLQENEPSQQRVWELGFKKFITLGKNSKFESPFKKENQLLTELAPLVKEISHLLPIKKPAQSGSAMPDVLQSKKWSNIKLPADIEALFQFIKEKTGIQHLFLTGSSALNLLLTSPIHADDLDILAVKPNDHTLLNANLSKTLYKPKLYITYFGNKRVDVYFPFDDGPVSFQQLATTLNEKDTNVGAIAIACDGSVIDITGKGIADLDKRRWVAIRNSKVTIQYDPVTALRAVKYEARGFVLHSDFVDALQTWVSDDYTNFPHLHAVVAAELNKPDRLNFVRLLMEYGLLEKMCGPLEIASQFMKKPLEFRGHDQNKEELEQIACALKEKLSKQYQVSNAKNRLFPPASDPSYKNALTKDWTVGKTAFS